MEDQEHPLKLYNSLTRKVERFVPQDASRVTMYNCGPTVYSYAHIGNARAAVVADVLFRVLRHIYGEEAVVYARNLTDVDDKIIAAATEQGVPMREITEKFTKIYQEDLAALNCLPPTHEPKATEHIQQMADIIVTLMEKDAAYESEGHIYFDVTKDADYGKLSGRKLEDNLAGARVEVAGAKRNAADFVLWKPAKAGEPGWSQQESSSHYSVDWKQFGNRPFATAPGRPGWHIECSAMAKATLGETIDIHCGGIDLKFPHHENEIAQSETANETDFAKVWVHNEFLNLARGGKKMSKSEGNVILVHDLLEDWDGEVIRLALLKAHYRKELNWSERLLQESKAQLDGWYRRFEQMSDPKFMLAYSDPGLPNPQFWTEIFEDIKANQLTKKLDSNIKDLAENYLYQESVAALYDEPSLEYLDEVGVHPRELLNSKVTLLQVLDLLGLLQRDPEDWFRGNASDDESLQFDALADARSAARAAKDWAEADRIRDEGVALGIVFEDGPEGTVWRKA